MSKPTVALVTGCFDLLHPGHVKFLNYASKKADILIVGVESDDYLKKHKGKIRPILTAVDRQFIISQLKSVHLAFIIPPHTNYKKLLVKHKIDCLVISKKDRFHQEKNNICQELRIKVCVYPKLVNYSSSLLLEKFFEKNLNPKI